MGRGCHRSLELWSTCAYSFFDSTGEGGLADSWGSMSESAKAPEFSAPAEAAKMQVNQQHLKQAWDTSSIGSREDWLEWMHRLSVEFMKESPSHALRACMGLVDIHPPLARELFNAAFISCWRELYEQYQVCRHFSKVSSEERGADDSGLLM